MAFLAGCDSDLTGDGVMPTRPVTVIELSEHNYDIERELTGVVNLYPEERIGFEIGGRVKKIVLNEGLEVRGPAFNERGELICAAISLQPWLETVVACLSHIGTKIRRRRGGAVVSFNWSNYLAASN